MTEAAGTPEPTMVRALTLWRPWTIAILQGPKRVENRPRRWGIPAKGMLLAIHAGKRWDTNGERWIRKRWKDFIDHVTHDNCRGGIVGACIVRQVVRPEALPDSMWAVGPWCYILEDVVAFAEWDEIPGQQGLWRLDPGREDKVRRLWRTGVKERPEKGPEPIPVGTLF